MPRRISKAPAVAASALNARSAQVLPVIRCHDLFTNDLQLACDLSDLLRESICKTSASTYSCGFKSLVAFCKPKKLCSMPVTAVTLCAWMAVKCREVKVKSVIKYVCGIRFAHILEGHEWVLSTHPLVKMTITSLRKKYPTSSILQKIPLSLSMLMAMCQRMHGWPNLKLLSFNDLTWATASAIAFYACLRGGEFFIQPKSERPILSGAAVTLREAPSGDYVYIEVPTPKTRQDLKSIPAIATSTVAGFAFDPVVLLRAYRSRAVREKINVLGSNAAFKSSDGKPITRFFMVSRAEKLRMAAKIEILNMAGKPIKVSAASWRAGFVMSARQANVLDGMIRTNGRWTSISGPMPYSVDTLDTFQQMTRALVTSHTTRNRNGTGASSTGAGGQFASSSLLL